MTQAGSRAGKGGAGRVRRPVKVVLSADARKNMGAIETLTAFLENTGTLSDEDRKTIVDQALAMIDQTYVHLPLKRAMHAIDPVQRLRLLRQRLDQYPDRAFHNEMIGIFVHLRDLHTNYLLPQPYSRRVAFLPFDIEECFDRTEAIYIVTQIAGTVSDPGFVKGVTVTHWNGVPMAAAVDINADREAGSNRDARHLQGLQSMTRRWMGMALPPDEQWVDVRYLPDRSGTRAREARFEWWVFEPTPRASGGGGSVPGADPAAARDDHALRIGIDANAEMQRRVRKLLFAPAAVAAERRMADLGARMSTAADASRQQANAAAINANATASTPGADQPPTGVAAPATTRPDAGSSEEAVALAAGAMLEGVDLDANSILPDVFKEFRSIAAEGGPFGYIRLVTFEIAGGQVEPFIAEFIRIAALLPQDGLILDVRGNGGGTIAAGEALLQLLTPQPITPARFHFINTPTTLAICTQVPELAPWRQSIAEAIETGSTFSKGIPLTSVEVCNKVGQTYQGPVVLIVDAGCYSTTDMFAAGFQDHAIGRILGTSGHTGAGGANVWVHENLQFALSGGSSPFTPLPQDASFRVAIRRSTRVGERSGEPLEDLGVVPEETHRLTPDDLLDHNVDLIARACTMLAGMPRQRLQARCEAQDGGRLEVTVTTTNIDRVDALLDARPVHTLDVVDGTARFVLHPAATGPWLELRGFRGRELVATRRLSL